MAARASLTACLITLLSLLRYTLADPAYFINPPASSVASSFAGNLVFENGSPVRVQLYSNASKILVELWQQAPSNDAASFIENVYSSSSALGTVNFDWTADVTSNALLVSSVYFFWVNHGLSGAFTCHYFNITAAAPKPASTAAAPSSVVYVTVTPSTTNSPQQITSSTSTTSTAAAGSTTKSTSAESSADAGSSSNSAVYAGSSSRATTSSSTSGVAAGAIATTDPISSTNSSNSSALTIGLGVGLGVGIPLILIAGIILGIMLVKHKRSAAATQEMESRHFPSASYGNAWDAAPKYEPAQAKQDQMQAMSNAVYEAHSEPVPPQELSAGTFRSYK